MIQIQTPLITAHVYFWSYKSNIGPINWEKLKTSAYRVAYVRGVIKAERILKTMPNIDRIAVNDIQSALKMMATDRFDIIISNPLTLRAALTDMNLKKPINVGRAYSEAIHPYLHRRHHSLAVPLANALKQVLTDEQHRFYQLKNLMKTTDLE